MGAAEFAVGPHPERAVRGFRRCPEEWQVLKQLQEGLTAPSTLSSPSIKAESSLWQFTPSPVPPTPPVLWGSWSSSPLPGPSMSKHEWVQSKLVPHTSTQAHKHTHTCFPLLSELYVFSFPLMHRSHPLSMTGPCWQVEITEILLANDGKWRRLQKYVPYSLKLKGGAKKKEIAGWSFIYI